jgi:hypothetical protein
MEAEPRSGMKNWRKFLTLLKSPPFSSYSFSFLRSSIDLFFTWISSTLKGRSSFLHVVACFLLLFSAPLHCRLCSSLVVLSFTLDRTINGMEMEQSMNTTIRFSLSCRMKVLVPKSEEVLEGEFNTCEINSHLLF